MKTPTSRACTTAVALVMLGIGAQVAAADREMHDSVARGRYVAQLGGCNDCHTPGYTQNAGKVAETNWLTGDVLGWSGAWGTTYPANLRVLLASMSEAQWIDYAHKLQARPPMPFWTLNEMSASDLRDLYRFVVSLGPAGTAAPAYLPPGQTPSGPFVQFPLPPRLAGN